MLATLRNLANGLYELERARDRTSVDTLKSWCPQQTCSAAWHAGFLTRLLRQPLTSAAIPTARKQMNQPWARRRNG